MRVLVVMEHPGIGSLHPVLGLLAERGHEVQLAFGEVRSLESDRELQELVRSTPGITLGALPEPGDPGQAALAEEIRSGVDYLRYLEPPYRDAHALRARAARKAPAAVRRAGEVALRAGPAGVAALKGALAHVERSLEPPGAVVAFLRERKPDVLVPLHLLPIGSSHADYLRAACRLGIRTVFPVRGWDNLTNKGLLRDTPGLMLVWNELQAAEAVELHGIPRRRIRLTGASSVDHWFGWQPSRTRKELCREVGLDPALPYVLYVCSSGFVAPDEVGFVQGWIGRLRARGGIWDGVGFLVRPHPLNAAQWADATLDGPQVRVWPRFGEDPGDDAARRNYFDSIYHSAAVVGINTTAQIEGAIVGRPVHTLLADEFRDTQQGTLHFQHLRADRDAHLYVARTFDDHARQLEESLGGRDDRERNERFLRRFVRPLGLDRSATEATVAAIEELGAAPAPRPQPGPALGAGVRVALRPLAVKAGRDAERRRVRAAEKATPVRSLQATVRALARDRSGTPVIAGPWLEDEVDEQRYWIPFLRWAQRDRPRLRERLFVVSRASSAAWYEDIGAGRVDAEEVDGSPESLRRAFGLGVRAFRTLDAADVAAARDELDRVPDPPLEATGV